MSRHKVVYTSMECVRESSEWGFHDEPYAIFVIADWRGTPWVRVRRTLRYRGIDAGEKRRTHDRSDNKTLTRSGRYEVIDPARHLILVQGMENDSGSAEATRRVVNAGLSVLIHPIVALGFGRKSDVREGLTRALNVLIAIGRRTPRSLTRRGYMVEFKRRLRGAGEISNADSIGDLMKPLRDIVWLASEGIGLISTNLNPEDVVGRPKELRLSETALARAVSRQLRRELTFSEAGEGKFIYKFSVYGRA